VAEWNIAEWLGLQGVFFDFPDRTALAKSKQEGSRPKAHTVPSTGQSAQKARSNPLSLGQVP
jgi:hypothetical protein